MELKQLREEIYARGLAEHAALHMELDSPEPGALDGQAVAGPSAIEQEVVLDSLNHIGQYGEDEYVPVPQQAEEDNTYEDLTLPRLPGALSDDEGAFDDLTATNGNSWEVLSEAASLDDDQSSSSGWSESTNDSLVPDPPVGTEVLNDDDNASDFCEPSPQRSPTPTARPEETQASTANSPPASGTQ
ncbi:hypothetical protein FS749_012266 [Ceratobasidium sp. UAMH 11750]|nr:hypothetical protein FS749_012266 [Ceratobasidium sp. UAMH 11750]